MVILLVAIIAVAVGTYMYIRRYKTESTLDHANDQTQATRDPITVRAVTGSGKVTNKINK